MTSKEPAVGAHALPVVEQAAHAAAATLGRMLGDAALVVEPPEILSPQALAARQAPRAVVVHFRLSGAVTGVFALVTSEPNAHMWAAALLGASSGGGALSPRQLSALTELGNIGVSSYLNSIAAAVRATCMPSVPSLIYDEATQAVTAALGASSSIRAVRLGAGGHDLHLAIVDDDRREP